MLASARLAHVADPGAICQRFRRYRTLVEPQQHDVAALANWRPFSGQMAGEALPLERREDGVPVQVRRSGIRAQELELIVVQKVPANGLAPGVVQERAAELHREDDRVAR